MSGTTNVHFSSRSAEWSTPQEIFDALDAELGPFDLDVCATPDNAKCERYFTPDDDGLAQAWWGACWMNPPYGREIGAWMRKAYEESQRGAKVVCLVPSRTDTRWWHDYAMRGEIRFIRGRLRFGGARHSAPFPSAIVVFAPRQPKATAIPEAAEIDRLEAENERLREKLPTTADGVPVVPGVDDVWAIRDGVIYLCVTRHFIAGPVYPSGSYQWEAAISSCYSTFEAAEAAREEGV